MSKYYTNEIEKRFFEKVEKTDSCWNWTASTDRTGYGHMSINGQLKLAHRISFCIEHGRESKDKVLHTCDNRRCVNPDHLREGTQKENVMDCIRKKRRYEQNLLFCPHGHPLIKDNIYIHKRKRRCKFCKNKSDKIRRNKPPILNGNNGYGFGNGNGFGFKDGCGYG